MKILNPPQWKRRLLGPFPSRKQGKKDEAIEIWREIANVAKGIDDALAARAWFSIGYLSGEQGKYEEAIAACNKAIRLKPDYAESYNNQGVAKETWVNMKLQSQVTTKLSD